MVMLSPLVATALAGWVLKSRVSARRWLLMATGFAGVLLVVRPGGQVFGWALLFPVLLVGTYASFQVIARIMRGSMIEVLGSPFIRTARAKGLPMHYVLRRHALKPAMLPVISYLGPAFVGVITGSVVVETFFGIPGMGQLFINGALNRDYSMVLGLTILVGTLMITFNAIVDILYGFIDPRIRIK
jgi:oligopeptide transport system permease protein